MAKTFTTLEVLRTEFLTDHMVRIWFGGAGFDDFAPVPAGAARPDTDMYVKIVFPPAGRDVVYPEPFDADRVAAEFAPADQPVLRTYTVRRYDPAAREIAIDFVVHGQAGIAGPWAARAQPGERVTVRGPGSGYRPDPQATWHLLASDEAGLPALAAALEAMAPDAVVRAFIEVGGPGDEIALTAPDGAEITWVHRGAPSDAAADEVSGDHAPLIAAVRQAVWLEGEPQVFIHGEAQTVMKNLRRYVRSERGVSARRAASISGYWRRGRGEEGFRQWKAQERTRQGADGPAPD
ncbi:MAG: siderophore-interacting protein [Gordonia sp. (in: high G+C Gram-positive bacteria)]|uniref:siderophore-interacting protein n=1 Tax=Gordonia sp. (in: high G+C Gram-positive bacteria) TaxID=84139 RepID=UPI003BB6EA30